MARQIPWTAWILFFAGVPLAFAGHPHTHSLCRYLGFGWGNGYHCSTPNAWYSAGCGCMTGCEAGCEPMGAPAYEGEADPGMMYGAMFPPAHQTAARYYIPPNAYQPYLGSTLRSPNAPRTAELGKPSSLK